MRFSVLFLSPVLLLAACTTAPLDLALPSEARDKIQTTEVILPVAQNEIYIYAPPSTAGAQAGASFGLIGALVGVAIDASVDANRTKEAEAAVVPLRDALVDFKFDDTLKSDVQSALTALSWMGVDNVHVIKEVTSDGMDNAIAGSRDGGVLVATADYRLENDASSLTLTLLVAYFPNNDALKALRKPGSTKHRSDIANAMFRDTLTFTVRLANAFDDRNKNVAMWSANSGALVRNQINRGLQKLAWMLSTDLLRTDKDAPLSGAITKRGGIEAQVVSSDADGQVVRFKNGALAYMPTYSAAN